jgi:copper resistance protein B
MSQMLERRVLAVVAFLLVGCASVATAQTDPHAGHHQSPPAPPSKPTSQGGHEHQAAEDKKQDLPAFVPPITDEDRKAAFPDVQGHAVHDRAINYFVLFDQLEWQSGGGSNGLSLDTKGWVGRDRDRLWFRAEGDGLDGRVEEAEAHVLYGRQISRWWDVVGGIRQDSRPGSPQTWAAFGIQGLAPYWFEIEATGYVGASGRTQARFEVEYELLLTNRLVAQPLFETEIFGKSDPERGNGAGLSTTEMGLRLRYEFRRELAPYIGVVWAKRWGKTADFAKAAGEDTGGARFVTGVRLWF